MTDMLWGGTVLLVALVAAAGCVAWLWHARHRKQSRDLGSVPSPATDETSPVEIKTESSGPTPPPLDKAERAGSQLGIVSETEPAASLWQAGDDSETMETVTPKPQAGPLKKSSRLEDENDFTEDPATVFPQSKHGSVSLPVDTARDSQTAEELPEDQPEISELQRNVERVVVPADNSYSAAQEAPSTRVSQKDDVPAQHSVEHVQSEPVFAQPLTELVSSRQSNDIRPTQELEDTGSLVLPDIRKNVEVEEHGEFTQYTTGERQRHKPVEAAVPLQVPIPHDASAGGGKRGPDELLSQTGPQPRLKSQRKEKRKHKPRKKVTRQKPVEKQTDESVEDAAIPTELIEITGDIEIQRPRRPPRPSRYHPPSQEPVTVREPSRGPQTIRQMRQQNFDLTVRLLFQRNGHFRVGLMPQRVVDFPEEITLGPEGYRHTVAAVHDAWYEDVYPEEVSVLLINGISWEGRTESEFLGYWTLSGRDLYVLACHELRGFVQSTRLKIGREHIVLCRNSILVFVEQILHQVGCASFIKLDESHGAPSGWTVFRGVPSERGFIQGIVPTNVVSVETGPEILSILQPEADLEIDLQDGIYLQQATWIYGFPPRICVSGDMQPEVEVFIDGEKAIAGDDGSFTSQGYDTVGEHVVSIPVANTSKTYRITEGKEGWTPWDAHGLSRVNLCGPLVRAADGSSTPLAVLVPSSNSVILGTMPGDIEYCPRIRGSIQVGCVMFDAVWALPYDVFGCNKETTTILLLSAKRVVRTKHRHFTRKEASRVMAWCAVILNASRKGLLVDANNSNAPDLWKEYKTYARTLWKKLKK